MIGSFFSILSITVFPLLVAAWLSYRINVELQTGRSYLWRVWDDRETQPIGFWFNIGLKAFGAAAFVALPLSILLISTGA